MCKAGEAVCSDPDAGAGGKVCGGSAWLIRWQCLRLPSARFMPGLNTLQRPRKLPVVSRKNGDGEIYPPSDRNEMRGCAFETQVPDRRYRAQDRERHAARPLLCHRCGACAAIDVAKSTYKRKNSVMFGSSSRDKSPRYRPVFQAESGRATH